MKAILKIFIRSKSVEISVCEKFSITDDEADVVYGGVKEYVPPIYEHNDEHEKRSIKISDLLTDIHTR